jgi:integrase
MLVVKVSGVKSYTDRHGKPRRYHRKSGTPIDPSLTGQALAAEVDRLDKLHAEPTAKAGTLGGLIESWKRSPAFTDLKPRTRSDYQKIMDYLRPIAGTPLVSVTSGFIAKLRDKTLKLKRAGFTNHMLAMLSSAFRHGLEYELADKNPVSGIGNARMTADRKKPNRPWTPEERKNVPAAAWPQLRLPILLARTWGIRRGDIVAMPRSAYVDGWLTFRAGKNNKLITLPVLGELRREMDAAMAVAPTGDSTLLCLNSRGEPWTKDGLGCQVGKFLEECRKRGIMGPRGSLHGLRHSVAAELRAAGYTAEQRKMVLGHDTDDMAEHYAASADVRGELIDMANMLEAGPKRERGLSNRAKRRV